MESNKCRRKEKKIEQTARIFRVLRLQLKTIFTLGQTQSQLSFYPFTGEITLCQEPKRETCDAACRQLLSYGAVMVLNPVRFGHLTPHLGRPGPPLRHLGC